ncbi:MAG: hypothetical protein HOH95_13765 [Dehalococcoidia bacterium]|jgi:hypothetical protein|nr:hypothetical protein [Dehalococcoidia bacterium]
MSEAAVELLSEDERADLDGVIVGLSSEVRAAAEQAYIEGRVAGLCREGALELASDVARESVGATRSEGR